MLVETCVVADKSIVVLVVAGCEKVVAVEEGGGENSGCEEIC